ncbi:uncharacterized protein LOC125265739 [Megalobrama amblycephala]|uniref:uncharacterized protein LOC125265739 n=1 Tax=Megalobrama amblycephala TaxID=75352 RepID=UPI0020140B84|nr:uncharacterized protein LOC125265739 [Megalobrama amblycephala]
MEQLHTSLVLFLLFCSPWVSDGKTFLTYLGTQCIEDCKSNWGEYKCKTIDDGKCQEMYCSPQENMDYRGKQCRADSMCGKHGGDYYWCRISTLDWGYCGLIMDVKNYYGSTTGALCYDHCDRREQDYYWCNTAQGWDYCSPSENTDYKNKQCKEDSPCEKQGENYYWCWLKEGSWGYCGLVEPKMLIHRSMYHYICIDECQYYESKDYYWCHTAKGWDYCSPNIDVTYKGKPCRSDHTCGLHGYSYNWCWTSESKYDYCGLIESTGECSYISSQHRKRRAPNNNKILICKKDDKGTNTRTTFTAVPTLDDIADGSRWRNEAENLISRWNNQYLVDQSRSNLIRSDNLRIDMQGTFNRNNQRYYNLQIQVNENRRSGQSTTVSQIIVPRGIPDRYIRRAFVESFERRARVFIEISSINQC